LLQIVFEADKSFHFSVVDGNRLHVRMSPGDHRALDLIPLDGLSLVPRHIKTWVGNIYAELRATLPAMSEIDELRKALDAHIEAHITDPDEQFSSAEAAEVQAKLDAVVAELERLKERDEITQNQLDELVNEVGQLKDELNFYTKSTWYRTAGTKLWSLLGGVAKSAEAKKLASDLARKAIGLD